MESGVCGGWVRKKDKRDGRTGDRFSFYVMGCYLQYIAIGFQIRSDIFGLLVLFAAWPLINISSFL